MKPKRLAKQPAPRILQHLVEMVRDFRESFGSLPDEIRLPRKLFDALRAEGLNTAGGVLIALNPKPPDVITFYVRAADLSQGK